MKTVVQIPKTHFSTVVNELAQFPLCYERFKDLNLQWEDCTIEASLFHSEQPGVQSAIPHITYEDKLQTTSMEYERDEFGNSDEAVAEYGEYLYSLLDAL
ncbi:MAG: hypothetical protein ACKPE3_23925, partial [Sphaerospermopsis kisseleviana]